MRRRRVSDEFIAEGVGKARWLEDSMRAVRCASKVGNGRGKSCADGS